jgi:hypothetical protein
MLTRLIASALSTLAFCGTASAQQVFTGLGVEYAHEGFTDITLPENQDRITDSVWITRGTSRGIFNIAQEPAFQGAGEFSPSPVGTRWAIGSAEQYQSLSFGTWGSVHLGDPGALVGVDLVIHLVAEDIYIDARFTNWGGISTGGRFTYRRSALTASCNEADIAEPFGVLDLADITAFVDAFINGEPAADIAFPFTVFDLNDITAFVAAFTAGCP